ncbi:16S rRNA (guanine(966)-N(2))-methyltransferase RsmD [Novosphingobium umbonatum]|uniref:16S rRNA (Guanine(966)-N(2))-methyltransferase RsmD n=1 Tax=Novosphingobium umbonatum TaxID=1908524 RepID=A0A3S2USJ4_9SPHN|nr:16S rRNA (guanine(966)-N(2))-methyltransferase RsmD [Novosphingobium umbonatum]RVU03716.1 16S rRNA (guanine(966)-N(2))-methyltransferase RsmD [Novosphingobium umbonatum]
MIRIISGQWRGRKLQTPEGEETTRPTSERTRETLFSMLASRLGSFEELRFADLFAGSGALGLEALSRGAAHCIFAEQAPPALRAIRANVANLKAQAQCDVRATSVMALGPTKQALDVVLLDPPYGTGAGEVAIDKLRRLGWINEGTWVALETGEKEVPRVKGFAIDAERKVGKGKLTLMRLEATEA